MASGLILTAAGAAEIEAAYQAGNTVIIPVVAFGDGGGQPVTVDPARTTLVNKFGECPFSHSSSDKGMIGGTAVINCRLFPGEILREFGLMSSKGTLIAYGAYPDTYLPEQSDSIVKEVVVEFVMPLVHAEIVSLVIDPHVAIMTQETSDARYLQKGKNLSDVPDKSEARGSLGVYSKDESDNQYQPKGNYAPAGASYTKAESDQLYQPKGNYMAAGYAYSKAESDNQFQPKGNYMAAGYAYSKAESDNQYQQKGNYATAGSSYTKAESDALFGNGVTSLRMANYGNTYGDLRDSQKTIMTGIFAGNGYDNVTNHEHRQLQFEVAGNWYNVAYV